MRLTLVLAAAVLFIPTTTGLTLSGANQPADLPDAPSDPAVAGPGAMDPSARATPPPPCPLVEVPFLVDECGDTMIGDLAMQANVVAAPGFGVDFPAGALRGDGGALTFGGAAVCLANFLPPACGDITSVVAGIGLTGGAASGAATLAVNPAAVQTRVTGSCLPGNYVRAIDQAGAVTCGADANSGGTVTSITAGTGLSGGTITTTGTIALLPPTATGLGGVRSGGCTDKVMSITTGGTVSCAGPGNTAAGAYATVGGGAFNTVGGGAATVAGGRDNIATDNVATIGGGITNLATNYGATVAGGAGNTASGYQSSVGGGGSNVASNNWATIPGGFSNFAFANAFAAGNRAKANHQGSFVWADFKNFDFPSAAMNEFAVRASGGARIVSAIDGSGNPTAGVSLAAGSGSWSSLSDRGAKTDIQPVDAVAVLARVATMPMSTWSYRSEPGVVHLGPMAQDFRAAFGLGPSDRTITSVDADGVALAAIQGLVLELQREQARNDALETRLAALEARLG